MSSPSWISAKEAARKLGYAPEYVARLCRQGSLECKRDGSTWSIREDSLDSFVARIEQQQALRAKILSRQFKKESKSQLAENVTLLPPTVLVTPVAVPKPRPWYYLSGRTALLLVVAIFFAMTAPLGAYIQQVFLAPAALPPETKIIVLGSTTTPPLASGVSQNVNQNVSQNIYPIHERTIERAIIKEATVFADTSNLVTHDFFNTQLERIFDAIADKSSSGGGGITDFSSLTVSDIPDLSSLYLSTSGGAVSGTTTTAGLAISSLDCSVYNNGGVLTTDSSGNVICDNDTAGSGSGTPGGSDTYVQYNDGGDFGGDAGFTYNETADRLTVSYASTTGISTSYASTTNLVAGTASIGSFTASTFTLGSLSGILKATGGVISTASAGTDYVASVTGDWTGTFDGQEGSYYLDARNQSNFVTPFSTALAGTSSVASITTLANLSLPYSQLTGAPTLFSYPFLGNATSTLLAFNGGATFAGATTTALAVTGSSTISSVLNVGGAINAHGGVVGNLTGNADTVTNGVYTTTFNSLFDPRFLTQLSATSSISSITALPNLALAYSQLTGTPAVAAYPFTLPGNATSTLTQFNGGLTAYASSTLGNGTQTGGLTISGGATTTGLLVVTGSGTSTITGNFNVQGQLKVGTGSIYLNESATSTFTSGISATSLNLAGYAMLSGPIISSATDANILPYASTTALSATALCLSSDCRTAWPAGSSSFDYLFAPSSNFGTTTSATSSSLATAGVFFASSTSAASQFPYASTTNITSVLASTTNLTVSGVSNSLLSTNNGAVGATTLSAPLSFSGTTLSITQASTGANGYLSSTDFNTFNNKISSSSLSAGAGISYNSSTGVIANTIGYPFTSGTTFGTTTSATSSSIYTAGVFFASSTVAASQLPFASTTAVSATTICLTGDTCRTTWPTSGSYPFTVSSNFGTTTSATSSSLATAGVFFASSTSAASQFPYASSTALTVSGQLKVGTGTGLALQTSGVFSAYAGTSCTNQALTALNASGVGTCSSITDSYFSGQLGVSHGGTGSNLSATGGTSRVLMQTSVGGAITVAQLACSNLSNGATSCSTDTTNASNISSGTLGLARGGTGADLSATGGTSRVLMQTSSGATITVARLACSDLSNAATSCSTDATNASNISSGTLATGRGGTGVTSFGGTNTLLYTTSASTLSSITTGNNGVLVTSSGGVPSISSTLPSATQANITSLGTISSGTWQGSVVNPLFGGTGAPGTLSGFMYGNLTSAASAVAGTGSGSVVRASSPTIGGDWVGSGSLSLSFPGFNVGTATGLCISNQGDYFSGTFTITTCSSDARLKHDIAYLDASSSLDAIMKIKPARYVWNSDESSTVHAGFIAQDTLGFVPEAVGTTTGNPYYTFDDNAVLSYAVSALQEINRKVDRVFIIATTTATTTPAELMGGAFGAATDALKSAAGTVLEAVSGIAHSGVRMLGDAVYAGVGIFNDVLAQTITATNLTASAASIDTLHTEYLCVGATCVTEDEFLQIMELTNSHAPDPSVGSHDEDGDATSTPPTTSSEADIPAVDSESASSTADTPVDEAPPEPVVPDTLDTPAD